MNEKISFEPFCEKHIPFLIRWLKNPHVKQFWQEPEDENELRKKYLDLLKERGISPQIILLDERPIGYIQSYEACLVGGGWWPDMKPGVFGMDQMIGEPELVGRGLGPKMIRCFIEGLSRNEKVKEIIVDPDPTNLRAIQAYEKVGFRSSGVISTPNGSALLMHLHIRPKV